MLFLLTGNTKWLLLWSNIYATISTHKMNKIKKNLLVSEIKFLFIML